MAGFLFGGDTGVESAAELARKREIVNALLDPSMTMPQTFGEGLTVLGRAIAGKLKDKKLSAKEDAERARVSSEFDAITSGLMGGRSGGGYSPSGTWTPAPPPPDALEVAQGTMKGGMSFGGLPKADLGGASGMGKAGLSFGAATMTPQEMLIAGAEARGWNPIDVATAISYETGGTFDPLISGPTTQWGTHRGPIQFGEPQAEKYGIDFSSPEAAWRSSLNPTSGGVWRYLEDAGVKPGMGLDQIYSAINAGGINRFGASDANNGGAPGTVADKVAGMGDHRVKAAEFLGGTWTPSGGDVTASAMGGQPSMGMDLAALSELAANPYLPEGQRAIVGALLQQAMTPPDPMAALELEKAQLEIDAMKNPKPQTPEALTERQALLAAAGIDPASPEGQNYLLTGDLPEAPEPGFVPLSADEVAALGLPPGSYQRGPNGEIKQIGGGGTSVTVNNGSEVGTIPQGYEMLTDPATGARSLRPIPGGPEDKSAEKASGDATASDTITTATMRALEANNERILGGVFGALAAYNPSTPNAEVYRQVDVLKSNAQVGNLQAMRNESPTGGALGSVTEGELKLLSDQAGTLDPASPHFQRDLMDYTKTLLRTVHGKDAGDAIFAQTFPDAAQGAGGTKAPAPEGVAPDGVDPELWAIMTDEEKALWAN